MIKKIQIKQFKLKSEKVSYIEANFKREKSLNLSRQENNTKGWV